jgi:hypothetical protein
MFALLRRSAADLARLAQWKPFGPSLGSRYVMRRSFNAPPLPARPVKAVATRVAAPFVVGVVAGFVGAAAIGTAECAGGDGADAASDAEMMSTTAAWSTNPLIEEMCVPFSATAAAGRSKHATISTRKLRCDSRPPDSCR